MLLVTDKLEKTEPKYDLLKEEFNDLSKDQTIEYCPRQRNVKRRIYFTLIGLALLIIAAWHTFIATHSSSSFTSHEPDTRWKTSVNKALNETDLILSEVQDSINKIRQDNAEIAVQYIEAIKGVVQDRTIHAVNLINRIVSENIREIENELTSFDYVIKSASERIVGNTLQNMKLFQDSIASITNETYKTNLEDTSTKMQNQLTDTLEYLDEMYMFHGSYMIERINRNLKKATDGISKIVYANPRLYERTIQEKANFCHMIEAQNLKISRQLKSLIMVFGILTNITDTIGTMQSATLKNTNQHVLDHISESKLTLKKAQEKTEATLQSILKDDDCFLGSTVRETAYKNQSTIRGYIENNFAICIWHLSRSLNDTLLSYKIAKESHRKQIEEDLTKGLEPLSQAILEKINSFEPQAYDEYSKKFSFLDVKSWMETKFQYIVDDINPRFAQKQSDIIKDLETNLKYIVFQQVPFISSFSVQNYLPTDVCPSSTDYQKFLSSTMDIRRDPSKADNVRQELAMSANFSKESDIAQRIQDGGINEDDSIKTDEELAQKVKQIIQKYAAENEPVGTSEVQVTVKRIGDNSDEQDVDDNQRIDKESSVYR